MPIDHEELSRQARAFRPRRPAGIAALAAGVHRDPALRSWLTMESSALIPVPARDEDGWSLWSLIAIVRQEAPDVQTHQPPWGAVQWEWPTGRVVQLVELARRPELAAVLDEARGAPTEAWQVPGSETGRWQRDEALERLTELLASDPDDLSEMAVRYERILPAGAYPLYWALATGSRAWLRRTGDQVAEPAHADDRSEPPPEHLRDGTPGTPTELASRLGPWLRSTRALVDRFNYPVSVAQLADIERRHADVFRLAVIGTGPSLNRLVNALAGSPVLPAGEPLTVPVAVLPDGDPHVEITMPGSGCVSLPLEDASWSRVSEDALAVRVLADSDFLRAVEGELVVLDTDGCERHRVADAAAASDVVLLAVRATSPLGMAERELLESQVLGRHVQRVAVVVTLLDHIDDDEREPVLRYIANRAERVSPAVHVLTGPIDGSVDELTELRTTVLGLADAASRRAMRHAQVTGQLADLLGHLVQVAEQGAAAAAQSAAERSVVTQAAEHDLEGRRLDWLDVRNELQRRGTSNVEELRSSLLAYRAKLLDHLGFDLKRSREPRRWWEDEFGYRFRRELEATVRRHEDQLGRNVAADLHWLDSRTAGLFGRPVATRSGEQAPLTPDDPQLPGIDAPDLSHYRVGLRIAPAVAGLLGSLLIPGGVVAVGLASAATLAAGELRLQGMITEEHQLVAAQLPAAIDRGINGVSDELSNRVRELYAGFLDDTERAERAWHDAQLAAVRGPDPQESPWPALAAQAQALHDELRSALHTETGGAE